VEVVKIVAYQCKLNVVELLLWCEDKWRPMSAASEPTEQRQTETAEMMMTRSSVDDAAAAASSAAVTTATAVTLSRSVLTLSHSDLRSTSSLHDVTSPLEVDVIDDSDCGVSHIDRLRVEMFYRSHETDVYVCSSLADLFVGALRPPSGGGAEGRWVHVHTGVPVWLLNSGRGRRRRELLVVVAERRTGLPLWHDRITYLSNYAQADEASTS